ncbi:MAG: acetyl-CoA/propionyl-CoA carboxylase, biotin carboxylase, biotin carboxyl carrier protein [Solirubrobacteraceae bacterium]|jgi:3-methylcrotonyl-CoA carboxylase alpha subunit/acetyl-CoA/propionyl-CoA carboxylase biotin carboxyl carrier protein|nr:acetyl-CoA/propionyl-CoA carboxylase, biotin carboxylase, biotin carboxyl carrier protein [Solirubrobacteraceae bacterium]
MAAFDCVLVANRGEIAIRVLRAARAAALRTVAVYSDADRTAPHVREADAALRIGPAPAAESYLSIPAILDAAERSGAQAVHPGYGFLSENAGFARACEQAGLTFVGPPADVIELMGRKDRARRLAVGAGVPVVPALDDAGDAALLERAGAEVGFPLMVKAAAGGGGKGMRIVRSEGELAGALRAARREAKAAFGDDTLLLERLVEHARHVEVQVLADAHGAVVHLFERDCSTQRRHQKVIEEAPAPTISPAVREAVTGAAVRLAREVGYVNAGTVEFVVAGDELFFLEMNTRLQVEHPVTELVCGVDLVALQLAIAQGEPLPFAQDDVTARGHAIEARVYAEDPDAGFLPQAGTATTVRWSARARVDAALEDGQEVLTHYDPMLGKVIAHGVDREAARRALVAALDDSAILGVTTNLGFLRRLAASPAFARSEIHTTWLDDHPDALPREDADVALCAGAWSLATAGEPAPRDPFGAGDGFRLGGPAAPVLVELEVAGERRVLRVDVRAGTVAEGERSRTVRPLAAEPGRLRLEVDGEVHELQAVPSAGGVVVVHRGEVHDLRRPRHEGHDAAALSDGSVVAPMPGTVVSVDGAAGDAVRAGQTLVVMEAMKMELSLQAPIDGAVRAIHVAAGDQVALGHPLFEVDAASADGD